MATSSSQNSCTLKSVQRLAALMQDNESTESFWLALSDTLDKTFSHTSCTVLSYNCDSRLLLRLYSSRPDVHRPGGYKQVTSSHWSRTVLDEGRILIGSNREDIKAYFAEYEDLWANGWESILNIPVKRDGKTIGTINIMNASGAYDNADHATAILFAQLTVAAIERATEREGTSLTEFNQTEVGIV
ncbi:hypothetical protein PFICI_09228 [Pestalotiopsis fici W106-1]|uniref:GAF domain-containing protein n=1 Tax=Pestalotiopsis fici (strain W106-1 / CGMCC3.15140) TaxID=1229662 RepID=W3WZV3_PESFW|nr:uncharacterized protein PFICI_09228 [Pestalotiopsis fici W106-1]ETS79375.1 hypothetical protein PFICI_09228 [Pestalotiopsis fici W106-1]